MATEARMVEIINKIIGGLSSSIANPVRTTTIEQVLAGKGNQALLHSTEFLPCAPVCSA
jgi:hypothetical protein